MQEQSSKPHVYLKISDFRLVVFHGDNPIFDGRMQPCADGGLWVDPTTGYELRIVQERGAHEYYWSNASMKAPSLRPLFYGACKHMDWPESTPQELVLDLFEVTA